MLWLDPTIFKRFANSQTGHLSPLPRPRVSTNFDYEGELAIIIGKPGRYIARDDAMGHIAGYACYNDGSVRDFQRYTHQFTLGKNFPETGAFGPWMVTPDEMGEIGPQRLQTRLNGEIVQNALLSQMIFGLPQQIEYCSSFTRLEPGDVVEVEIDGVGLLRNPITQEA